MIETELRDTTPTPLRAIGISNWALDKDAPKRKRKFSVQFYDYDLNGFDEIPTEDFKRILEIFPLDCLLYRTKHGVHFISFAIRMGLRYTKSRAIETSKDLGKQDFWNEGRDLTLRVSPKWKIKKLSKRRQIISKKPEFLGIVRSPDKNIISEKHLEFYFKYMNLPEEIYNLYQDCEKKSLRIKIYHYKTRD